MDTPLPPPRNSGIPITPELLEWIDKSDLEFKGYLKDIIEQRTKYGMEKYGQPLMSDDGRDDIIDALQEAGDLIQYVRKSIINGHKEEMRASLDPIIKAINKMLE
jgi:hypothetical protein